MSMATRIATLTSPDGYSLVFSNVEDPAGDYQAWLTDVAGFYGGVGVADPGSQRKLGHGFFPAPSLRTGRSLTLSGTIVFKDETFRNTADRFLSGQLWDGGFGTLEVQIAELTLSCQVKLDGEIKHSYHGETALDVQIPLTAPDPFLYAPERLYQVFHAGTGVGLNFPLFSTLKDPSGTPILDWGKGAPFSGAFANQGNATAWPKVVVHGSFPHGFRIVEGSRVVEFPSTVHPTAPVEIDMRAGEVMVSGSDHTYKLSRRDWIDIPAQSSILPRIEALSDLQSEGWADFLVRDTYM